MQKCVNGVMVEMSPEEEAAFRALQDSGAINDRNNERLNKIRQLEASQARAVREHLLNKGNGRLQDIEDQISLLRSQLET